MGTVKEKNEGKLCKGWDDLSSKDSHINRILQPKTASHSRNI